MIRGCEVVHQLIRLGSWEGFEWVESLSGLGGGLGAIGKIERCFKEKITGSSYFEVTEAVLLLGSRVLLVCNRLLMGKYKRIESICRGMIFWGAALRFWVAKCRLESIVLNKKVDFCGGYVPKEEWPLRLAQVVGSIAELSIPFSSRVSVVLDGLARVARVFVACVEK